MPLRYVINLILIVAVWFVLNSLIQSGVITNYWSGILITVGINIILATSLNVATGYLASSRWAMLASWRSALTPAASS